MKKNPVFIILGILLGLNILAWVAVWDLGQERGLEVTFFDVSLGPALLFCFGIGDIFSQPLSLLHQSFHFL